MFEIPKLTDLLQKSRQAFRANLKGSDASIWPNNVYVTAKVLAGMAFEMFGFADYVQRQKFAITADGANLDLHGDEFGVPRKPARPATGFVKIAAPDALSVAPGAILRRSDLFEYRALVGGSIVGAGNLEVEVIATKDGKAGIAEAGTALEIVSGVTGSGLAEVADNGIASGADVEGDEEYRARILFRKRNPPHGGSAADYVRWAGEVSGVSRVFVERLYAGPGSVRVFVLMDDVYPDGIALPQDVARIADYIEGLRPAGAYVSVAAPNAKPINIQISGLKPNTTAVQEAVLAELREMFLRRSRVAGGDTEHAGMPFLASPTSFSRSWIWQAVANASGEDRHSIVSPAGDTPLVTGEIPVLGTVAFI